MNIYDQKTGQLNKYYQEKIVQYITRIKGISVCCEDPAWVPNKTLQALVDVVENADGKAGVTANKGMPVVTIVCDNCGRVTLYHINTVFREWMQEKGTR